MKKLNLIFGVIAAVLLISGCGGKNGIVEDNSGHPASIAAIFPADGSTGVAPSTSISIKFSGPVDTLSAMHDIHLAGGEQMHHWHDSLDHYGGYGMMSGDMWNYMMNWMDSIMVPGTYHWNGQRDSLVFTPNAALLTNTDYLCAFFKDSTAENHHNMMKNPSPMYDGLQMYGFTTGQ